MGIFDNLGISELKKLYENPEVKKAMEDGNITMDEYISFSDVEYGPISEDSLSELENELLDYEEFLKGAPAEDKTETEPVNFKFERPKLLSSNPEIDPSTIATAKMDTPSAARKTNRPEATVDVSGDKNALEGKLKTEEETLATNEKALSDVLSGSDKELEGLQKDIDTKYDAFQKLLKEKEPELAQKVDDKKNEIDAKKKEISEKEQAISDQDGV
ncbi:hypothetical protein J6Q66_05840, partial [bacterium]|nr:hypothetical protein [bacterium]